MGTTYATCLLIQQKILRTAAECIAYTNWQPEFVVEQLRGIAITTEIDPNSMSLHELQLLGFRRYNSQCNLWLIPLWLLPYLINTFKGGCISSPINETVLIKSELDNDNRYGCIAYGVFKDDISGEEK